LRLLVQEHGAGVFLWAKPFLPTSSWLRVVALAAVIMVAVVVLVVIAPLLEPLVAAHRLKQALAW
jgi:hypothetical protein